MVLLKADFDQKFLEIIATDLQTDINTLDSDCAFGPLTLNLFDFGDVDQITAMDAKEHFGAIAGNAKVIDFIAV